MGTDAPKPLDLASARVLITNDDGIDAEGLKRLEAVVEPLVGEMWTVAPDSGRSAASSMVSLRKEIDILERGTRRFAVTGSPADCTLSALQVVMRDCLPDIVISGINHGLNVGIDVNYSGTIGAASSAASNGIPAIAVSAQDRNKAIPASQWEDTLPFLPEALKRACQAGFRSGTLYNINLPEAVTTPDDPYRIGFQGFAKDSFLISSVKGNTYRIDHTGEYGDAVSGSDLDWVRQGYVAITPLGLDRTNREQLEAMQ